uniref:Uncharacterized protein n=1 Tax=Cucumis melo TaxID=3656 RepID=A0A9I9EDW5_CUCME
MTGERVVEFWRIFHMEGQILLAMEMPTVKSITVFQLSGLIDEFSLVWISSKGERSLNYPRPSDDDPLQFNDDPLLSDDAHANSDPGHFNS